MSVRRAWPVPPRAGSVTDARILGCRPAAVLDCARRRRLCDLARLTDAVEIGFDARGFAAPATASA